jgi:hypothetical protein
MQKLINAPHMAGRLMLMKCTTDLCEGGISCARSESLAQHTLESRLLGRTQDSYGKALIDEYKGGAIFVDHTTGYLYVAHQLGFLVVETI